MAQKRRKLSKSVKKDKEPRLARPPWEYWSPTKLGTALLCPFMSFHKDILREPAPKSPEAALGEFVHYALKRLFSKIKKFPYEEQETFRRIIYKMWFGAVRKEHGFGSHRKEDAVPVLWQCRGQEVDLYKTAWEILKKCHQEFVVMRQDGVERWPERRFKFIWNGLTFSGIIDRLDLENDGPVIWDYKPELYDELMVRLGILQMSAYQLAYEIYFREKVHLFFSRKKIEGSLKLKGVRIYNYRNHEVQEIPLRKPDELGIIPYYLMEASSYFRGVLTGIDPDGRVIPSFKFFNEGDFKTGDISPKLPRGGHCRYCECMSKCQEWQMGRLPTAKQLFEEKHQKDLKAWQPTQERIPLEDLQLIRETRRNLELTMGATWSTQMQLSLDS